MLRKKDAQGDIENHCVLSSKGSMRRNRIEGE
jgi:hypothetical protein